MYPEKQKNPTDEERYQSWLRNPEGAAARGKWGDPAFLEQIGSPEFNAQLKHTQFADFHGHGWVFRAVYKRDRKGNLLDAKDNIVANPTTRTNFRRPSISRTFTSKRACTAPTAISSRTATATAICTARRAMRSRSIASIATEPSREGHAEDFRRRRARKAATTCRCCARRVVSGASTGRTANFTSAFGDQKQRALGSGAGHRHDYAGQSSTTAKPRVWPRRCGKTEPPGVRRETDEEPSSRTPTPA